MRSSGVTCIYSTFLLLVTVTFGLSDTKYSQTPEVILGNLTDLRKEIPLNIPGVASCSCKCKATNKSPAYNENLNWKSVDHSRKSELEKITKDIALKLPGGAHASQKKFSDIHIPWYARDEHWHLEFKNWMKRTMKTHEAQEWKSKLPMCYNYLYKPYGAEWVKNLWHCHQHLLDKVGNDKCEARWGSPGRVCRHNNAYVEIHYIGSEKIPARERRASTPCYNVAAGLWWILTQCPDARGQIMIPTEHKQMALKVHDWANTKVGDGSKGGMMSLMYYKKNLPPWSLGGMSGGLSAAHRPQLLDAPDVAV